MSHDDDIVSTEVATSCSSVSLIISYYSSSDDAYSLSPRASSSTGMDVSLKQLDESLKEVLCVMRRPV